jgi:hypothetical protein
VKGQRTSTGLPAGQCGASTHWFAFLRLWDGPANGCLDPTRVRPKDRVCSVLLPVPLPSSARPRALGPALLDFATCRLTGEPFTPAERELDGT